MWLSVDPLASKYPNLSPYTFVANNPIMLVDPDGNQIIDYFDLNGKKIGTDGNDNDTRSFVVTNKKEIRAIKKTDKKGGATQLSEVKSAKLSPSKASLTTAAGDLTATQSAGGTRERASITFKDGTSVSRMGPEGVQNGPNVSAEGEMPILPDGYTQADIESYSHSHLTAIYEHEGMEFVGGNANDPSPTDKSGVFRQSSLNIISGPLGQGRYPPHAPGTFEPPQNGIVVYRNGKQTYSMTQSALTRMLRKMR